MTHHDDLQFSPRRAHRQTQTPRPRAHRERRRRWGVVVAVVRGAFEVLGVVQTILWTAPQVPALIHGLLDVFGSVQWW